MVSGPQTVDGGSSCFCFYSVSPTLIQDRQSHPLLVWVTAPKSDLPLPKRVVHHVAVAELRKSLSWWWLWATMSRIPYFPRVSQQTLRSEMSLVYRCKDNTELLWCTPKDSHCPCIKFLWDKTKLSLQLWCQGKKICGSVKEERERSRFSGTLLTSFFLTRNVWNWVNDSPAVLILNISFTSLKGILNLHFINPVCERSFGLVIRLLKLQKSVCEKTFTGSINVECIFKREGWLTGK